VRPFDSVRAANNEGPGAAFGGDGIASIAGAEGLLPPIDEAGTLRFPQCGQSVLLNERLKDKGLELAWVVLAKISEASEQERFLDDIKRLEKRAARGDLEPEEVSRTFTEIARLMDDDTYAVLEMPDRIRLAEQVLHQSADPTSISQGKHGTCSVSAVEARIYRRCPSAAARLVADVALNGLYRDRFGRAVRLDAESLKPDMEAQDSPPQDGERSFASQLFQVTAVNLYWQRRNQDESPGAKSIITYKQLPDFPRLQDDGTYDSGERLIDSTTGAEVLTGGDSGQPVRCPWIETWGLQEVYDRVSGQTDSDFVLANYAAVPDGISPADKPGRITFRSEEELGTSLAGLQKAGEMPIVIKVFTGNEPLKTDSGTMPPQWHYVTIRSYDPVSKTAMLDNQRGRASHHTISLRDLYRCTLRTADR